MGDLTDGMRGRIEWLMGEAVESYAYQRALGHKHEDAKAHVVALVQKGWDAERLLDASLEDA